MRTIGNIKKKIPPPLLEFASKFRDAGFACFLVGGALRNMALGKNPSDFDVATDALPDEVMRIFKNVIPTGIRHGTVIVRFKGLEIETTTFRSESGYSDGRHPDSVAFSSDILEDLKRRDFTMNGMAYDLFTGILIDPGGGLEDLKNRRIRAIGVPGERFAEDGLRPMRAVRFASQLGFEIEGGTFSAIPSCLEKTNSVSKERLRDEFDKILLSPQPSYGLRLMEGSGLLRLVLPELADCRGVEQNGFHSFDVLDHSLLACDASPPGPLLRTAALFHDIGKPETRSVGKGGEFTFYGHEAASARIASRILRRLKYPRRFEESVLHLIRCHMFNYEESWTDSAVRRFISRVGQECIDDLFALRAADTFGMRGLRADPRLLDEFRERIDSIRAAKNAFSLKDLAVNGEDLFEAGIPKGREMGMILAELLDTVIEDPGLNERARLLEIAAKMKAKYRIV